MGSSGHWGLITVPGQEENSDNLGIFSISFTIIVCWVYLDEAILMSTHNIQFRDKIKISLNICFLELAEVFRRDSKISSN